MVSACSKRLRPCEPEDMIALIDYKAGNLTSVKKALAAVEADVYVPARPDDLDRVHRASARCTTSGGRCGGGWRVHRGALARSPGVRP